jgi:TolB-like protein
MGQDETGTLNALKQLRADLIDPSVSEYNGRIVKLMGDGTLVEFASVVDAVECAVSIQRGIGDRNLNLPDNEQIILRIGINLGDVIVDADDIYGDGVNVAARLENLAAPGSVCVAGPVFEQVKDKLDLQFDDLGEQDLKNIAGRVRAYRVRLSHRDIAEKAELGGPAKQRYPDKPSIAILPFDCYPADDEQEAFANGMTEDLTTDLSKVAGLFVIARNSAQAIKGRVSSLEEVAQTLGVRYLLEGSVRKSGATARINAQLIDASTGGHLWAERFDGNIDDVFALQDEVSAKVVDALSVELSQDEKKSLGKIHTNNLDAYELFVRAKAAPYPPIPHRIKAAREMFETVIDMAPDFAGGYAGASAMIGFGALWAHQDSGDAAAQAEELAHQAICLDETFAWSYTALGLAMLLQRRYPEAVEAAQETVVRQPSDADGYTYLGLITMISGDARNGARFVEEAIRLNPRFFAGPYWNVLGQAHALSGDAAAAIEALETNIIQHGPMGPPAFCSRAAAYAQLGDLDKANAIARELIDGFPQFGLRDWTFLSLVRPDETRDRHRELLLAAGVPE